MMNTTQSRQELFESAPVPRAVRTLVIPTIITQLINVVYNFADTWYVGRTGNPAMVAALSVSMPVFVIMAAIANLFGIGGSSVISRSLGMRRPARARGAFAFCFYGGLAVALLYAALIALVRTPLIYAIGGNDESFRYIYDYMFWTMIVGAVPTVGNVLCGHLVRSVGASKEAGIGMSFGGILNIFLDPLFMFVILPPGNEVIGAAIATMLSNTAALLFFLVLLHRRREDPVMTIRPKEISLSDGIPADVLLVGFPAALQTSFAMISNIAANIAIEPYGNAAVAGMGVAKKINTLAFNTTMGLTQGVLPLIGYNYGAKNHARLKETIRFTAIVGLAFTLLCMVSYRTFAGPLTRFFINEEASVAYGAQFLRVIALATPLAAVCYLANAVFQAAGRKWQSFLLAVLRKGILDIPAMFAFRAAFGAIGVVWATPFAEVLSTALALYLMLRFFKSLSS